MRPTQKLIHNRGLTLKACDQTGFRAEYSGRHPFTWAGLILCLVMVGGTGELLARGASRVLAGVVPPAPLLIAGMVAFLFVIAVCAYYALWCVREIGARLTLLVDESTVRLTMVEWGKRRTQEWDRGSLAGATASSEMLPDQRPLWVISVAIVDAVETLNIRVYASLKSDEWREAIGRLRDVVPVRVDAVVT